jgi:hypothetical protein
MARVRTIEAAAAFVDGAGLATLFPKADVVLPSLWEATAGPGKVEWGVQDEEGGKWEMTPEFSLVWGWKDELPARRLAAAGKHCGQFVLLVAPRILPALYAVTGRRGTPDDFRQAELGGLQLDVAEALLEHGTATAPQIRQLLATDDRRRVASAIEKLQRLLVLTNVGVAEQHHGWGANTFELVARQWRPELARLPSEPDARDTLARTVLDNAGELSAADLAGALGWRVREAATVLERLGLAVRDEDGIRLWSR